jgi:uncharacterized protein YndB with AHSA1/START domain
MTMSMETLKLSTPSECEIAITRVFDAPRALVFEGLTTPEILKRWFGLQPGRTLAVCEMDLKVGGAYRWEWRGPNGTVLGVSGVFQEVAPPERISQTENFDEPWYPGGALVTLALAEDGGKTTLTLTVRYESQEARDEVLITPMQRGLAKGYGRLADVLAPRQLAV